MNLKISLIVGFGVLLLLGGIAMPAQQTETIESCVDSDFDAADGCVETTTTVPNYGKYSSIVLGLIMVVGGIGMSYAMSDSDSETTITSSSITEQSETSQEPATVDTDVSMLHEEVQSGGKDSITAQSDTEGESGRDNTGASMLHEQVQSDEEDSY